MVKRLLIIVIVVSAVRRGSIKGYPACLSIFRFPHSRLSYFDERSCFLRRKTVFFASRAFKW